MSDDSKVPEPEYVSMARRDNLAAQARLYAAQAEKAEHDAAVAKIARETAAYEDRVLKAHNDYAHTIYFTEQVSSGSVDRCVEDLDIFSRVDPGCDIEIVFTSPGGDVVAGMRLFDHIMLIRGMGHKVTIGTLGMAASMAGILLQAGEHRWMGAEAYILIHQISATTGGSFGDIQDRVKWFERVQDRILDIFAARAAQAGRNGTAAKPASKATLVKNWTRTDWWLDSAEAIRLGIVDEVRGAVE